MKRKPLSGKSAAGAFMPAATCCPRTRRGLRQPTRCLMVLTDTYCAQPRHEIKSAPAEDAVELRLIESQLLWCRLPASFWYHCRRAWRSVVRAIGRGWLSNERMVIYR